VQHGAFFGKTCRLGDLPAVQRSMLYFSNTRIPNHHSVIAGNDRNFGLVQEFEIASYAENKAILARNSLLLSRNQAAEVTNFTCARKRHSFCVHS